MKPIASTMTEIDNLPGEEVEFTISEANKAWVMRSMADLYSNRELACIREYSTNAYDSNKEKAIRDGHEVRPIRVTLPNALNPYFSVKDEGVGMSERTLKETYTQFGESTKRDSDEFNGMLGFGSKSAVAYTNTFTVTSVKDGHKTVAVVTRREDALGGYILSLKVILSVSTAEVDGVEVQIPVHNWQEFERKAVDFYRFWPKGTVLVNGREPKWDVGEKIGDDLYYSAHSGVSYVVMGKVPYRIVNPDALFPRGMNRISFVAYLDTCKCDFVKDEFGTPVEHAQVEFTPSREDLKYSDHTKHHLRKIINDFVATSVQTAKDEIGKAKTHQEAFTSWSKWRNIIGSGQVEDLTFKGDKFVNSFAISGKRYDASAYRYGTWDIRDWEVSKMNQTVIITNFTPIELASSHKKKVKDWANFKAIPASYFIFVTDKSVKNPWIPSDRVVEWETVKAEAPKAPRKPRQNNGGVAWGRKAGSFDLITASGTKTEQDVPNTKELYYITVQDKKNHGDVSELLRLFEQKHEVVLVPGNRLNKFLRCYPEAKEIIPHLKSMLNLDGPSMLDRDAMTFLGISHTERASLSRLKGLSIDDPEIVRLIKICSKPESEYMAEYNRHQALAIALGEWSSFKQHKYRNYWDANGTPLTDNYPLAEDARCMATGSKELNHIGIYINAVYSARKGGKSV